MFTLDFSATMHSTLVINYTSFIVNTSDVNLLYNRRKSSLHIFLLRNLVVYCRNVDIIIVLERYSNF